MNDTILKKLNLLPKNLLNVINASRDAASLLNSRVYLVGGFVRDILLSVPDLDLDLVVEGDGLGFAKILSDKFGAKLTIHKRFGTATFITPDRLKIDIATARKEIYPYAGSLPEVEFGLLKDDLSRRDFTINAMALSLNKDDFLNLIDLFNGQDDLKNKKISILHELSFVDDPTRILRAIRFKDRYGFSLGSHTKSLLRAAVNSNMLSEVHPHRLRDEIMLLLKEKNPISCINSLYELCGFDFIQKGICFDSGKKEFLNSIHKNMSGFNKNFPSKRRLDKWVVYLIGLLEGVSVKAAEELLIKFAFPKGVILRVLSYKKQSPSIIKELSKNNLKASQVYRLLEPLSYEVVISIMSKSKNINLNKNITDFLKYYGGTRVYISGRDIVALGVKPGPAFKMLLQKALYAKIDGKLSTKQNEIDFVKSKIKK